MRLLGRVRAVPLPRQAEVWAHYFEVSPEEALRIVEDALESDPDGGDR